MSIIDIIKPIQLLRGSHNDTGSTGRGCFMNVVAYLNGEPQITDQSECVCFVARPIAIWVNDFATDEQRQRMLPLIERAMGSTTTDKAEIERRLAHVVAFANYAAKSAAESAAKHAEYAESAKHAAKCAKYAAKSAAESAAEHAEYAECANYAAKCAAESANYAAKSAAESAAIQNALFEAGLRCLGAALPPQRHPPVVTVRARELVRIAQS